MNLLSTLGKGLLFGGILFLVSQGTSSPWVRQGGVLFGIPSSAQRPASLLFRKAWAALPEVQRIRRDDPPPATRSLLLAKASARLKRAIRKVAYSGGYDCIVKAEALCGKPPVPLADVTAMVLRLISHKNP